MAALFPPWANVVARATLIAAAAAVVGVPVGLMAWVRTPNATRRYQPVSQPVAFDHRVHVAGEHIDCRYCHFSVERSSSAGLPPTTTCVPCHSQTWLNSSTLAPVRQSIETNTPLRWNRVTTLPGFVYFNHAIHVNKGVGCETCHGRVDRMGVVYQDAPMTMSWCVSCHLDPAAHVRPRSTVTTMGYVAAEPQRVLGARLVQEYRLGHLTNCSTCHR
ncbi:MAG TPA: cytochrome c3 family protein [Gemmatimonadaceae bacterium]|nr:cytochrome c3 family protein [Gemmatimonadaceae bacterium]